jgi:hypothetical protein
LDERRRFNEMLAAVRDDADRVGIHAVEDVLAEMDAVIDEESR